MARTLQATRSCGRVHAWCAECRPDVKTISPRTGSKKGRRLSPETRQKMSLVRRGKPGRPWTVEARQRLGERMREVGQRPEVQARRRGQQRSGETRAKISAARKRHIETCGGGCNAVGCVPQRPQSPTRIEDILVNVLLVGFPEVRREARFGRFRVDAYLPEYHLAFEADGVYWHRDPESDIRRDAYLLAEYSLPVVRLKEAELLAMTTGER